MVNQPIDEQQIEFLRQQRLRMVEEYLTGDPSERKLWFISMVISLIVVPIVSISFAAFSMLFARETKTVVQQKQNIIQIKRIKPPPPPKQVKQPPKIKKVKIVPIPDPTPDEPEPIVPPEEEEKVEVPEELENFDFLGDVPDAPPEVDTGPVRIGVNGVPPKPIRRIEPLYPEAARRLRIEGVVILEIVVKKDGTVGNVRVLRSLNPLLDQAAIDAVRQWRFQPGLINGRPVDAYYTLTVRFSLSSAG